MKAILEFNLPDDQGEFERATQAGSMHSALWEIAQEVFRPARKHGYSNARIQELLDLADGVKTPATDGEFVQETSVGTELVSELEKLFYQILEEHNIKLL